MLIQWPILIWMFSAMRAISNEQMVAQVFRYLAEDAAPILANESWLWVKNIWTADSFFTSMAPDLNSLQLVGAEIWEKVYNSFTPEQMAVIAQNVEGIIDFSTQEAQSASISAIMAGLQAMPSYQALIAPVPGWANVNILIFKLTVFQNYNGWLILPAMAGLSQVLYTKIMPQQENKGQNDQTKGAGKFMQIFFPFLSVYFCLTSNAGFAIYLVTSNIVMGVTSVLINKYLEKQDKKNAASVTGEGSVK
jgi:membrane protein insertase Oxa1/YidC/SpoIIIJ